MFPFTVTGGTDKPIRDDIAWLSWLYPEQDFQASTGTISGRILRRSGGAFLGANVVATRVSQNEQEGLVESLGEVVSAVSDFLLTDDGSYELPGLQPGDYVVFIEPLDSRFLGGSSVGPFEDPFRQFGKDYYNSENESGSANTDDPSEKMVLIVGAGQTVEDINLTSNEAANRLDLLTDDDQAVFEFPLGFSFPFFGKVYTEVVVNSDGNLTFGEGDSTSNSRDETRFLSGPPRIAPLFTDLNPEDGGEITAAIEDGSITFTWEDVPEFSSDAVRPGNIFSVRLFANGDILFSYDAIDVSPDLPADNTRAVVGIGPGNTQDATSTDLSSAGGVFRVESGPVYEVFTVNAVDLMGQQIVFEAASSQLLFPFFRGDEQNFSGYAITNFSAVAAQLRVEGRGTEGNFLPLPANPQPQEIRAQSQLAKLGSEFFQNPLRVPQSGWIRLTSNTPELAGFFQFGNGLLGPRTRMDGSAVFTGQSQTLFFTRILDGLAAFSTFDGQDGEDAMTFLSVANPNNVEIRLTLQLFDSQGNSITSVSPVAIPPLGQFFDSVASIFGTSPVFQGYVQVDVDGPGAIGFALIELEDTLVGLNASFGNDRKILYSAQLANGQGLFTSLSLVNTSDQDRTFELTAFGDDGTPFSTYSDVVVSKGSFQDPVDVLFGLGSPTGDKLTTGSVQIEVDGPGVIGDVLFGKPTEIRFAAALPLQVVPLQQAIFSQVANEQASPQNGLQGTFTGIALFNPSDQAAQVLVQVFDRDGNLAGETTIPLGSKERLSRLADELIPSTAGLVRGYILIESDRPLIAQQLFGNHTLQFLSAVPPTIIE